MASPNPPELTGAPQFRTSAETKVCPQAVLPKGPLPVDTVQSAELALSTPTHPLNSNNADSVRMLTAQNLR